MNFSFRAGPTPRPANRLRLVFETLEARENPTALTDPAALLVPAPVAIVAPLVPVANKAPVISDFRAVVGPNGQVTFSGRVTDDQAVAGDLVMISGEGVLLSAIVAADGTFSASTIVYGTSDVTVTARVTDLLGATSDPAQTTFTPSAGSSGTAIIPLLPMLPPAPPPPLLPIVP